MNAHELGWDGSEGGGRGAWEGRGVVIWVERNRLQRRLGLAGQETYPTRAEMQVSSSEFGIPF
jgi:hypothetical protein